MFFQALRHLLLKATMTLLATAITKLLPTFLKMQRTLVLLVTVLQKLTKLEPILRVKNVKYSYRKFC